MLSVLRVINAVVISRGQQNERTIQEARQFLSENRSSIVSVFKRNAGIGTQGTGPEAEILNELVDQFTLLMSVTDFLEVSTKILLYGEQ
jgi:nuclear pore complex protein Nup205